MRDFCFSTRHIFLICCFIFGPSREWVAYLGPHGKSNAVEKAWQILAWRHLKIRLSKKNARVRRTIHVVNLACKYRSTIDDHVKEAAQRIESYQYSAH